MLQKLKIESIYADGNETSRFDDKIVDICGILLKWESVTPTQRSKVFQIYSLPIVQVSK